MARKRNTKSTKTATEKPATVYVDVWGDKTRARPIRCGAYEDGPHKGERVCRININYVDRHGDADPYEHDAYDPVPVDAFTDIQMARFWKAAEKLTGSRQDVKGGAKEVQAHDRLYDAAVVKLARAETKRRRAA